MITKDLASAVGSQEKQTPLTESVTSRSTCALLGVQQALQLVRAFLED